MKRFTFCIAIFSCLLVISSVAVAGFNKVGTSAAQFLKVGVGARALAMGGAFAAVANDASSLYWNPAGIAAIRRFEFTATHTEWIADISHDFAGLVLPFGNQSSFGISATVQSMGEMEQTTIEMPRGTGIYFDAIDMAFGVSYARYMTDFIIVGITGKYIHQRIWNESASTVAVDLGTWLDVGVYGLKLGMVITNFGGKMKLGGRELIRGHDPAPESSTNPAIESYLKTEPWPLPTNFQAAVAFDMIGAQSAFLANETNRFTVVMGAMHPSDNPEHYSFGAEYGFRETFFGRFGYQGNTDEEGFTFGAGLKMHLSGNTQMSIDYAYSDFGIFDFVQHFSLGISF